MNNQTREQQIKILKEVKNFALVVLGCVALAFGDALFLAPCGIVSGGVSSVGIIINYWIEKATGFDCTDIVISIAQVILWLIGFIVLGKKFSIRTLVAMIVYPLAFTLIYRLDFGRAMGMGEIYESAIAGGSTGIGPLLLCAVFGSILCGVGTSLAYFGNGSTGGFNVISFIVARYSEMKEDKSSLIIDSTLIAIGALVRITEPNIFALSCVGVLCAITCALTIQFMYVNASTFVICNVISDKYEEINEYIINEMDHSTTIIDIVGGYTGEKRKMMVVVIYEVETTELRQVIASLDPRAFVSFTRAKAINGEGFEPFYVKRKKIREIHKSRLKQPLNKLIEDENNEKPSQNPNEISDYYEVKPDGKS